MTSAAPDVDTWASAQPEGDDVFNTLIVAADLAAGRDRAVGVAVSLARHSNLPVELVSVVPPSNDAVRVDQRERSSLQGVRDHVTLVADDVGAAIVDHVRNRDGALLVMTTGGTALLSGQRYSVTGDVLAGLIQPVLLLGPAVPDAVPLAAPTLVAGIDRAREPALAVPVIDSWQRTFGGHRPWVVDVVAAAGWPAGQIDTTVQREHVDSALEVLAAHGIDAHATVLHTGDPVSALLHFAEGLDDPVFVVQSDRWAGGPSHWYSTARRLVQRSPRPVLVVPRDLAAR